MGTKKKTSVKTKKQKINLPLLSYCLNGILFAAVLLLTFAVYKSLGASEITLKTARPKIDVNLGSMQYNFTDGRAIKRTDTSVKDLQVFLKQVAEKDLFLGCASAFYNVIRHNTAETQVLVSYGCDTWGAHMFAVKDSAGWRFLSPTNEFDDLGIPSCNHVTQNNISPEIAPVCAEGLGEANIKYITR